MKSEELFVVILSKYQPLLKSLSNRYQLRGEYEEIYAEAVIALYEAFLQYDPEKGHFAPYAKRYVAGKLLNYLRKELRYRESHVFPSQLGEMEENWEERIEDTTVMYSLALSSEMIDAITQLSIREQKAIIHYFVFDRSLEELAKQEQVSHSTVSTWKRRGLAKLQRILAPLQLNHAIFRYSESTKE